MKRRILAAILVVALRAFAQTQSCATIDGAKMTGGTLVCNNVTNVSTVNVTGTGNPTLSGVYQFQATVSGTSSNAVTWKVNGVAGGNSSVGTISSTGVYTALNQMPSSPSLTIAATSTAGGVTGSTSATLVFGVPPQAVSSGDLDAATNWEHNHDAGTPGTTSNDTTTYPVTFQGKANSRQYSWSYTDYGGEIYHISFAADANATHFIYDTYVYLVNPEQLAQLEMDMNQVQAAGSANDTACAAGGKACTQIFGNQCDNSGNGSGNPQFDYTYTDTGSHWHAGGVYCKVQTQFAVGWHHIQYAMHQDHAGHALYDWIGLDGSYWNWPTSPNVTSNLALGWSPIGDLLLNLQFDGINSSGGSATAYTNSLQVWRW
jgi:hypothetical protein